VRTFLLSSEKEIIQAMKDVILSDHATRKYINFFTSVPGISIHEYQYMNDGKMYYRVNSDINGLKFSHTSEILNFTLP
jgi:hypothetical protein